MENPTADVLIDYNLRCVKNDWTFEWSDDGRVYREGRKATDELYQESKTSMLHEEIFLINKKYGNNIITLKQYRIELLGIFGFIPNLS